MAVSLVTLLPQLSFVALQSKTLLKPNGLKSLRDVTMTASILSYL